MGVLFRWPTMSNSAVPDQEVAAAAAATTAAAAAVDTSGAKTPEVATPAIPAPGPTPTAATATSTAAISLPTSVPNNTPAESPLYSPDISKRKVNAVSTHPDNSAELDAHKHTSGVPPTFSSSPTTGSTATTEGNSTWARATELYSLVDRHAAFGQGTAPPHRSRYSISGDLISLQPPRSSLSLNSSSDFPTISTNVPSNNDIKFNTSDSAIVKIEIDQEQDDDDEDDENYIPPPPPKYINSKLDDVRSRLLFNPKSSSPPRLDDDMGTAAVVLSNMRSSPFKFNNRSASFGSSSTNSRPQSSSFNAFGLVHRPVIHLSGKHRLFSAGNELHSRGSNNADDDDDDAVWDDDDEDDQNIEHSKSDTDSNKILKFKNSNGKFNTTGSKFKEVTWNKNGKRINGRTKPPVFIDGTNKKKRKLSGTISISNNSTTKDSLTKNSVSPITPTASGDSFLPSSPSQGSNTKIDSNSMVANSKSNSKSKKNNMGTRSRNGCWICRLRKKKCTEEKPNCYNCERLNLECFYDNTKPDFVSNPMKKQQKLEEIKKRTKEAKRNAMRKRPV